jgi:SAM-dependent methyltransferase
MRILESQYLTDGRLYNDGRAATLIEIQDPSDYDLLLNNIINSGYYGEDYYKRHLHHEKGRLKHENLCLAQIAHLLNPGSFLELGCGRGDVLYMLNLAGHEEILGLDISQEVVQSAPDELKDKIQVGGVLELCRDLAGQGRRFDTITGFDIWEHLHPAKLNAHIEALGDIATDDAVMFFIIPAFGRDRIFGEKHPLEFEENRPAFDERRPFDFLMAESLDPPIPNLGHLIWAHSEWWEGKFKEHGFHRAEELEKGLHQLFDPYLFRAQQSFFVLTRDTVTAAERITRLCNHHLHLLYLWRTKLHFLRVMQNNRSATGVELIETAKLTAGLDDVGVRMYDSHMAHISGLWDKIDNLERENRFLKDSLDGVIKIIKPLAFLRKLVAYFVPDALKHRLR